MHRHLGNRLLLNFRLVPRKQLCSTLASQVAVVDGLVGRKKISVSNGRLVRPDGAQAAAVSDDRTVSGWSLAQNGFCLLRDQPMPVQQELFDEMPGRFGSSLLFRFRESEAEHVVGAAPADPSQDLRVVTYYKHIAEAVKVAMPEAEYVIIHGHVTFSAEVSALSQVKTLLWATLKRGISGFLTKTFPGWVQREEPKKSNKTIMPVFGAAQFLHTDTSAEMGADGLQKAINAVQASQHDSTTSMPQKYVSLPVELLSDASKQRRVVSVNMWRNLRAEASIKNNHLAVMDAQKVTEEELHAARFKNYAIGGQEQYHIAQLEDRHQLVFFPDMAQDEILCFKQGAYDVRAGPGATAGRYAVTPAAQPQRHYVFHTSFIDPAAPADALPRKSVVCAAVNVVMPETETAEC